MKGASATKLSTAADEAARNETLHERDFRRAPQRRAFSVHEKLLLLLFLLTLPLVNPWVRGDGVGYYAYVRALLIEHRLRFENDWRAGNTSFTMGRVDASGRLYAEQYTATNHVANHFAVGASMLWSPFLVGVHGVVLGLNQLGAHISADGFSQPYRVTMAVSTALYGFLGLCLVFRLARGYFEGRWAFLATLGIWFGSSLPVYMYFNPSWSHAHSAFAVALFLWYWHRTRGGRRLSQWVLLGALSGLMINVYYPNGVLLVVPALEALADYARARRQPAEGWPGIWRLLQAHLLYGAAVVVALLPTLVTRQIIYGSPFELGYAEKWFWTSPALLDLLFASNHGLFSWTPILIPAVLGLLLFWRREKSLGGCLLAAFLVFYYLIASYSTWDGLSSFGNRFFVSLTPLFVLGLAASLERLGRLFVYDRTPFAAAGLVIALLVVWNWGFLFQWGTHMIPVRGPISWRAMVRNQLAVVPARLTGTLKNYLVSRREMMRSIEQEDLKQLQPATPAEK